MPHRQGQDRYVIGLLVVFLMFWVALAFGVEDRSAWMLENVLTLVMLSWLVYSYHRFRLSRLSYSLIFVFLCIHVVGAHYTYSLTPYDALSDSLFGATLSEVFGWERNHYDRFVHLCYGLLIAYPIREMFLRVVDVHGFWGYFLPLDLTISTSFFYEMIEWGAALVFGGELGMAYLGTQGDIWDAHKDIALGGLGAIIPMAVVIGVNVWLQRDFAAEWAASFRVKHEEPLGEEAIARMLADSERNPHRSS